MQVFIIFLILCAIVLFSFGVGKRVGYYKALSGYLKDLEDVLKSLSDDCK